VQEVWHALRDGAGQPGATRAGSTSLCQLESRILLSATPIAVAAEALPDSSEDLAATAPPGHADSAEQLGTASAALDDLQSAHTETEAATEVTQVVVIDAVVSDADALIEDLLEGHDATTRVFVLESDRDGIEQISELLQRYDKLAALHLVSHSTDNGLLLGSTRLTQISLAAYAPQIGGWSESFSADADILLYGCDLAATAEGRQLVEGLRVLTGTDVAASNDGTGHEAFTADWVLEYQIGTIEHASLFSTELQESWRGKLATVSVTQTADVVNGDTASLAALQISDGGDGISLREAILAANNGSGGDTLLLGSGTYTLSIAGSFEDAAATGDLDILRDLTIVGAGMGSTIIDGSGFGVTPDRVLEVHSAVSLTINDASITGGDSGAVTGGGIYVDGSLVAERVSISGNRADSGAGLLVSGNATLTDTVIRDNLAGSRGGGIRVIGSGTLTLDRGEISENSGDQGGGIYHEGSLITLTNTTISSNTAQTGGGGIYARSDTTLLNCTIAFNDGNGGADTTEIAGIRQQGGAPVTLTNTILHNPLGRNSSSGFTDGGGNIISDTTAGFGANVDPQLATLAPNGGAVRTHAIDQLSPAYNAGVSAGAPAVDARGLTRDASPDIGAFEAIVSYVVTSTDDSAAPGTLRWAITQANLLPDLNRIEFAIPDSDARHFYYQDDGAAGLSVITTTTGPDAAIGDFDADYPATAFSWFSIDVNPALSELTIESPVIIDGYSQPGAGENTLTVGSNAVIRIELTSSDPNDGFRGLVFDSGADGSLVKGLTINDFEYSGVMIDYGVDGVSVQGNHIGTDVTGTVARGNGDTGIQIRGNGNTVGGTTAKTRNVISGGNNRGVAMFGFGTLTANVIENNYIGVDSTGTASLGNQSAGIQLYNSDSAIVRNNVISGNAGPGLWFRNSAGNTDNIVQDNLIGTLADGISAAGNSGAGVLIDGPASGNRIGTIGAGNTIAHNSSLAIDARTGVANSFRANSMFANGSGSIGLSGGANGLQPEPTVTNASLTGPNLTITGSYSSPGDAGVTIELDFFASSSGAPAEGRTWLGTASVLLDGTGAANFSEVLNVGTISGSFLTATVTDASGNTSELSAPVGIVTVTNSPPTLPPTAAESIPENTFLVKQLSATDVEGDTLTFAISGGTDQLLFTINGANQLLFTSAPDYESPSDVNLDNVYEVQITVDDERGGTAVQDILVTVTDVNEFSVSGISDTDATSDDVTEGVSNGTAVGITALATDPDGTNNTVAYSLDDNAGGRFAINGTTGVVTVANTTLIDYETDASHDIIVRASSNDGSASTRTFTIAIGGVNDHIPVITSPATAVVPENQTAVMVITATDGDVPVQPLSYSLSGGVDRAVFTLNSTTGALRFLSAPDFESPTDVGRDNVYDVDVSVSDGRGGIATQSLAIRVADVAETPIAVDDAWTTAEDTVLTVGGSGVLTNDSDPNGDPLTVSAVSGPTHGSLTLRTDGSFVYRPQGNYSGSDAFSYRVSDGTNSAVATVSLTVTAVNDAPTAGNQTIFHDSDGQLIVNRGGVLQWASDADGDTLTPQLVAATTNGTLSLLPNGNFRYQPDAGFTGSDTFTYQVSDGTAVSNTGTVTIVMTSAIPAPDPGDAPPDNDPPPEPTPEEDPSAGDTETPPVTSVDGGTGGGGGDELNADNSGNSGREATSDDAGIDFAVLSDEEVDEGAFFSLAPENTVSVFLARLGTGPDLNGLTSADIARELELSSEPMAVEIPRSDFLRSFLDSQTGVGAEIDAFQDELASSLTIDVSMVGSVATVGSSLTVGFLLWAARGGMLASGVLAQWPAWKLIDPTYVLEGITSDEESESLQEVLNERESMIEQQGSDT
jgi:parallel beta-helix repeat protein/predicted outer membrane repeat protein